MNITTITLVLIGKLIGFKNLHLIKPVEYHNWLSSIKIPTLNKITRHTKKNKTFQLILQQEMRTKMIISEWASMDHFS